MKTSFYRRHDIKCIPVPSRIAEQRADRARWLRLAACNIAEKVLPLYKSFFGVGPGDPNPANIVAFSRQWACRPDAPWLYEMSGDLYDEGECAADRGHGWAAECAAYAARATCQSNPKEALINALLWSKRAREALEDDDS